MEGLAEFVKPGKKLIGFTQSVSWFEFLLDPSLLEKHLNQEKPGELSLLLLSINLQIINYLCAFQGLR